MRPVINLKSLNEYVVPQHFKMEGIHTLKDLLRRGDWMTKIDLKDAYFTIPIHSTSRSVLRFSTREPQRLYEFSCLPFGLSCAPWVFTKTLKPALTLLRELGIRLVAYIDDILVLTETEEIARNHTSALIYLLESLGYIVHPVKTVTIPSQEIEFLGMMVDSRAMELRLPGQKLKKLRLEAAKIRDQSATPSAREVSRLLGKFNSVTRAVPPSPLFCRAIQRDLAIALEKSNQSYNAPCQLSPASKEELDWWTHQLARWNGKSLVMTQPDLHIESDASLIGWGAYCEGTHTGGPWSTKEKCLHINCLELLAAMLAVKTFLKNQENKHVLLLLDNTTAVAYVNNLGGTVSAQATKLARELWMWCLERQIHLTAQHLPGKDNVRADTESRQMKDRSDWMLNPSIFHSIVGTFPYLEVDLFATRLTSQLPRFFSWRPDPLAEATDAFLQDWSRIQGYANPPWNLVGRVLAKVQNQAADLILVAPIWPSQPWYPNLLGLLSATPLRIESQEEVIVQMADQNLEVTPPLAVWPISGNTTQVKDFQARLQHSCYPHGEEKSSQSYDSLCKKWIGWCSERQADPVSGPIEDVVNFLAFLYSENYQYRSLNSYRSAIASMHAPVDGVSIGQHPLVTRLLKGAFQTRPPLPRYTGTWDVNQVLDLLKNDPLDKGISLKHLSHRTVMLLALTRPSRSLDLAKLDLRGYRNTPEGAVFTPFALAKQSRPGKEVKEFFFPSFPENIKLCPVHSLKMYIERTKALRGDNNQLFISFIKPHGPVTSSTIARWLKEVMAAAGIDTSTFKAHSVRSASTSAASMQGVTTQDILSAADWSTESTFQKFYYKPVRNTVFAKSVLAATKNTIDMETEPSEI